MARPVNVDQLKNNLQKTKDQMKAFQAKIKSQTAAMKTKLKQASDSAYQKGFAAAHRKFGVLLKVYDKTLRATSQALKKAKAGSSKPKTRQKKTGSARPQKTTRQSKK